MAKLNKELKDILDKYGIEYTDKSKLWDCHGTLVLYHKAYEIIAAQENIRFDPPTIIEGNAKDKTVSIVVTGHMGERSEWSFGEASQGNCTNKYPYAMAEKRAKDRVIAKLVGLAAHVYSEDEAEEFKETKAAPVVEGMTQKQDYEYKDIHWLIFCTKDALEIQSILDEYGQTIGNMPETEQAEIQAHADSETKARNAGIINQTTKFRFMGIDHALAYKATLEGMLPKAKDAAKLEAYMKRWRGKLEALDEALKAAKYTVDGASPYQQVMNAYNQQMINLQPKEAAE